MYKRVLLKLRGEALSSDENALEPKVLKRLAKELKKVKETGVELAIVVGGGNFIRGKMMAEMGMNRSQADYMGMLGTVINALAVQNALEQEDVTMSWGGTGGSFTTPSASAGAWGSPAGGLCTSRSCARRATPWC